MITPLTDIIFFIFFRVLCAFCAQKNLAQASEALTQSATGFTKYLLEGDAVAQSPKLATLIDKKQNPVDVDSYLKESQMQYQKLLSELS